VNHLAFLRICVSQQNRPIMSGWGHSRRGRAASKPRYTTCYNPFVRWRNAGIWDHIMKALAAQS
jgi:hypothetical protein